MTVAEIAAKTGIRPQRLRYVLDRGTVPEGERFSGGRGSARDLPDADAFAVAAAAALIDGGLHKRFATGFLRGVGDGFGGGNAWQATRAELLAPDAVWRFELGDGVYARVRWRRAPRTAAAPSPWVRLLDRRPAPMGYDPVVIVQLDLAELARRLFA